MTQGKGPHEEPPAWSRTTAARTGPGPTDGGFAFAPVDTRRSSTMVTLTTWMLITVIIVIVVRLLDAAIGVAAAIAAPAMISSGTFDDGVVLVAGGAIMNLLFQTVNGLLSGALLVLAIWTTVKAAGRGRIGAIILVVALVLSPLLYLIGSVISTLVTGDAGDPAFYGDSSLAHAIFEVLRTLLVVAALIVGAVMVRRWATAQG
ncbi:hypothetical protein [Brachybacterium fresconis]|uniref:Integral membrane protein n=1 Tax=Brachybacterium fresconis TaxID=173363 RepID=A0ABS4YJA4_9MICO|nr:hypothetical protein [Brachybacterium fresconis]MBP2408879.1 hypothetical protein [Brachybacterium fresconis]